MGWKKQQQNKNQMAQKYTNKGRKTTRCDSCIKVLYNLINEPW